MAAPLRINRRHEIPAGTSQAPVAPGAAPADEGVRPYLGRLVVLIPGEVVSLYLAGANFVGSAAADAPPSDRWLALGWAGFCLVVLWVIRAAGTGDDVKKVPPEWGSVIISTVAYLIWLYNVGCPLDLIGIPFNGKLGFLLMLGWTFIVPYFYKGEEPPPPPAPADKTKENGAA
jgi:hypothetical protein